MNKLDLRADLENRIYQPQKKRKAPKWIVFGAVAMCSLGTLVYVNTDINPIKFNEPEQKAVFLPKLTNHPFDTSKAAFNPELAHSTRTYLDNSEDILIKPGARKELLSVNQIITPAEASPIGRSKKQTVFNDDNYQPRGSVNSIAPPPNRYYDTGQARTNAQILAITSQPIRWQWKSEKSHRSGTFTYVQTGQSIDTDSVCAHYAYGSFIYRDCRKAAKKHFQKVCSAQFRAACNAGEMVP